MQMHCDLLHSNEVIKFFKTVPHLKCVQDSRSFHCKSSSHLKCVQDSRSFHCKSSSNLKCVQDSRSFHCKSSSHLKCVQNARSHLQIIVSAHEKWNMPIEQNFHSCASEMFKTQEVICKSLHQCVENRTCPSSETFIHAQMK